MGPFLKTLKELGRGRVRGLVFGPFGEVSSDVDELISFVAQQKAARLKEGTNVDFNSLQAIIKKSLVARLGLFIHREWARCLIDRTNSNLVIDYHSPVVGDTLHEQSAQGRVGEHDDQEELEEMLIDNNFSSQQFPGHPAYDR